MLERFLEKKFDILEPLSNYFNLKNDYFGEERLISKINISPLRLSSELKEDFSFGNIKRNLKRNPSLEFLVYILALHIQMNENNEEHVQDMVDIGVWDYLAQRESMNVAEVRSSSGLKNEFWLEVLGQERARELYVEGREMRVMATKVLGHVGRLQPAAWERLDPTKSGLTREGTKGILDVHEDTIEAILKSRAEAIRVGESDDVVSLGLVLDALSVTGDLRGVAIASNKQRFLESVKSGQVEDGLDFAFRDWPEELRSIITPGEAGLYYENAYGYLKHFPDGLLKYAQWKFNKQEQTGLFGKPIDGKSDLDFRFTFTSQPDTVQEWFTRVCESSDEEAVKSYLERVHEDRRDRLFSWHDSLRWAERIDKLKPPEVKSILTTVQNFIGNEEFIDLLSRYYRERDPFAQKPITSVRELKKRVFAIEASVDVSSLPPQLLNIIDAPGFNLSALAVMSGQQRFSELLSGQLDKDQPFSPVRRIFVGRPLSDLISEGLGSRERGLKGTASSSKKLYRALSQLIKGKTVVGRKMEINDLLNAVQQDLTDEVLGILQRYKVDVGPVIVAQVHAKSDPEGWVCGNYTDSCMPFGDRKNDDYMFNPSTQYFTVKYNDRIVAQSVVVDGRDERTEEDVIILDNIEVARNYRNLEQLLAQVYEVFWSDYTDKSVKIGAGFSDLAIPSSKREENFYKPKTPLQYSDARGSTIYDLPKLNRNEQGDQPLKVESLTEQDADLVTRMESEAYPQGMVQGKDYIASVLKRHAKTSGDFGATSFAFRIGNDTAGYVLALPEGSEIKRGETVLHIYDFATMPRYRNKGIAMRIMKYVFELASARGLEIEAGVRESTTGKFLKSRLVGKKLREMGFNIFEHRKLPGYLGGEDFSFIRIEKLPQMAQNETVPLEAAVV